MTAVFNVGDKVRYVGHKDSPRGWIGVEGEVVRLIGSSTRVKLTKVTDYVRFDHWNTFNEGDLVTLQTSRLELIPSFGFKDIQIGDTIRRTYKDGGFFETREGVVTDKTAYVATADLSGNFKDSGIAFDSDDRSDYVTIELISRPEKPKHWSEKMEIGSVGYGNSARMPKIFYKTGDNTWKVTYLDCGTVYEFPNTEEFKKDYGQITSEDDLIWVNK